jgi:hypothetical protein
MFVHQIESAIAAAPTRAALAEVNRAIAGAFAAGAVSEVDHNRMWELSGSRYALLGQPKAPSPYTAPRGQPGGPPSYFPPRRPTPKRSPDSLRRRRALSRSRPMPPALEAHFTNAKLAVMKIIADAVRAAGACIKTVSEIASRAGCCETSAKQAIREARALGFITTEQQPQWRSRHKPTIIKIVSKAWLAWLQHAPKPFRERSPALAKNQQQPEPARTSSIGGTFVPSTGNPTDILNGQPLKCEARRPASGPSKAPNRRFSPHRG